jgi:uncharacterized caspase-like protein
MNAALVRILTLVWLACGAATSLAQISESRIALIIGNSSYLAGSRLPNAQRDADMIAQTLREIGFTRVVVVNDADSSSMRRTLRDFSIEAEKADWAVVYYAGHGIEIGGTNYLIPVDARLANDRDAVFEAVPLEQVITSIEGARKLRLIILDACRDNPFIRQMTRSVASRSLGRGLARVEPEGGMLVAYAAKAGQIAFDGEGQNSPFVRALAKRITEPGLEINMVFRAVRDDVLAATNKKQEPFVYGSLPNEAFYFRPLAALPAPAPEPLTAVTLPTPGPPAIQTSPAPPAVAPRIKLRSKVNTEKPKATSPRPTRAKNTAPLRNCFTFSGRTHCE